MAFIGKQPTPSPLTASDITDAIITNAKLAQDIISAETELATAPASTDELLISDDGVLKRIDVSLVGGNNTPAWFATKTSHQSVSDSTFTDVTFETEELDSNSAFSSPSFTCPSGQAGKYFVFGQIRFETDVEFSYTVARIVHNSTNIVAAWDRHDEYTSINCQGIVTLSGSFTLKLQARQQSGGVLNLGYNDQGHVTYFGGYKLIGV